MKSKVLYLAFLMICFVSSQQIFSQITITLSDIEYQNGEYYKMYSRDGSIYIVTGLTGKIGGPYTWDFSTGPTDSDYLFEYVLPSSTPCSGDFPLATVVEKKTGGGDPAYMYLDFKPDTGRVNYGVCQPPTLPIPYVFNPPIVDFTDPVDYMDNWSGTTTFEAESSGFVLDVNYDFNAFCNAYGEIILPDGLGTFPCLQVDYLEHYKFYWSGILMQESYIRSYYWIIPEAGIAVIISSEEGSVPPPVAFDYSKVFSRMYESSKLIQSNEFNLDLTVFLEGAFDGNTGMMGTSLNPGVLPLSQPFNISPWNYPGTESVTSIPSVDIVDWVLIELRDTTSAEFAGSSTRIARQAAFLLNDGSVVGMDGTSMLQFDVSVSDNLFAIVWHRNHLGVISSNSLTGIGDVYVYNFSNGADKALGGSSAQKQLDTGIWGMIAGDSNADGIVEISDIEDRWNYSAGAKGYYPSDFNLNIEVNNPDKNDLWYINLGSQCHVPD